MAEEESIAAPLEAVRLFRRGRPADAIRAWIGVSRDRPPQSEVAAAAGLKASTFSSKLSGSFSWHRDELLKIYRWLEQRGARGQPVEPIPLRELLAFSGNRVREDRFLFESSRAPVVYRIGVVDQGAFAMLAGGIGSTETSPADLNAEVEGRGILPRIINVLIARRHILDPVPPRVQWAKFEDFKNLDPFDPAAADAYDFVLGYYPTPARVTSGQFLGIPCLRMPLCGVAETTRFKQKVREHGILRADDVAIWRDWFAVHHHIVTLREWLWDEASFLAVTGEVGHHFLMGVLPPPRRGSLHLVDVYDVRECAAAFMHLRQKGLALFLADEILATRVARELRSSGSLDVTLLTRPFHDGEFAPFFDCPDFSFDIHLPRLPVTAAFGARDNERAEFFERELQRLLDQEPMTLLECYLLGYRDVAGGTIEAATKQLQRYLEGNDTAQGRLLRKMLPTAWPST